MFDKNIQKVLEEARAKGKRLQFTDDGKLVFCDDFQVGGVFNLAVQRHELVQRAIDDNDPEKEVWARERVRLNGDVQRHWGYFTVDRASSHNLLPDLAINNIFNVYFGSTAKSSTWYIALFTSDSTPGAAWASDWGKTSGGVATELPNTSYDEGTGTASRQVATFGTAANKVIATSSPTLYTLSSSASNISIYGACLTDVITYAYTGTDKILAAATRFTSTKSGLGAADKINVDYSITGSST